MNWYAVQTKPRKEELVRILLEQGGLTVFSPHVLEWSASRGRTRERVNLLFPGYLFVRMSPAQDHTRVRWTSGVKRILGAQDRPEPVDASLVSELTARMGAKGYIVQRPVLRAGDRIEVRRGPFAGLLGVVESPSTGLERVRVLLTVFSRKTTVEVEGRDLVRLGQVGQFGHGC